MQRFTHHQINVFISKLLEYNKESVSKFNSRDQEFIKEAMITGAEQMQRAIFNPEYISKLYAKDIEHTKEPS